MLLKLPQAGFGIAQLLSTAMMLEDNLTLEQAAARIFLNDLGGLLTKVGHITIELKLPAALVRGFCNSHSVMLVFYIFVSLFSLLIVFKLGIPGSS